MTLGVGHRAGQAALALARRLHLLLTVLLAASVLGTTTLGMLAWRLSQGPLDITWAVPRIERSISPAGDTTRITIASAALAWEGFRLGLDHPLDLRLTGVTAQRITRDGTVPIATVPAAEVSLSFAGLLFGRLQPRAIGLEGARLRLLRGPDGTLSLGLSASAPGSFIPLEVLLAQLGRPAADDHSIGQTAPWSQLARVRINDTEVEVIDRQLGATWRAPHAAIDLQRRPGGGVDGTARFTLALGDHTTTITARAQLQPGGVQSHVQAHFSPLAPASLAAASPLLAPLVAVDAPLQGTVDLTLGAGFAPQQAALRGSMGAGTILIGQSALPLAAASLELVADPANVTLQHARVTLVGSGGGQGPVVQAHATAHRADAGFAGQLALDVDQVPFADLGRYWPRAFARDPRAWLTANITAGTARAVHAELGLAWSPDSGVTVTSAAGQATGDDLTLTWLAPVPPIEHAKATVTVISPDELLIAGMSGRQAGTQLVVRNGTMRITGLTAADQYGAIDLGIGGPVADALAVLRQPRLHLLSRHPVPLGDPSGQAALYLGVNLLLDDRVTIDQIGIRAQGHLTAVHLGHVLAGRDLDQGALDLDVTNDGLRLGGPAVLAGVPAAVGLQMDFRAGPPSQVLEQVTVNGTATTTQLAVAGLDAGDVVSGKIALQGSLAERRDGSGTGILHAELGEAGLRLAPLGWAKPPGTAAIGDLRVTLDHDRLVGIDRLSLAGDGLAVEASGRFEGGSLSSLQLDRLVFGQTLAAGAIQLPSTPGEPIRVSLTGAALDLSGRLAHHAPAPANPPDDRPGRAWVADLKFGRVILGPGRTLGDVSAQADSDGRVVRDATIAGRAAINDHVQVAIASTGLDSRTLTAEASDAGALLRAFDVVDKMTGGTLSVTGRFDDRGPDHTLTGTADMSEFRLGAAPVAARVLKAMTLYGLADVLQGPGLGFSRMVAPFRLRGGVLDLLDARAFSPSLGFTAKGRVDLDWNTTDVEGTVVPAYFFNTLLGRVPMVGPLFSPEPGGGVFAATYAVKGSLDDPSVTVNPLAALTPGFLRGLFGVFSR